MGNNVGSRGLHCCQLLRHVISTGGNFLSLAKASSCGPLKGSHVNDMSFFGGIIVLA